MKFCSHCDNMLYIKINEPDNNQLNYYCRSCGFEDSSLTEEALCILDTQIQKKKNRKDKRKEIVIYIDILYINISINTMASLVTDHNHYNVEQHETTSP